MSGGRSRKWLVLSSITPKPSRTSAYAVLEMLPRPLQDPRHHQDTYGLKESKFSMLEKPHDLWKAASTRVVGPPVSTGPRAHMYIGRAVGGGQVEEDFPSYHLRCINCPSQHKSIQSGKHITTNFSYPHYFFYQDMLGISIDSCHEYSEAICHGPNPGCFTHVVHPGARTVNIGHHA
jgi:hypothetical protein